MDDIKKGDPPVMAPLAALRARLGSVTTPSWAKYPGAAPRPLALGVARHLGVELLPGAFAPVLLTLAALWAARVRLHVTAVVLLCEALALAHIGLCLLSSMASDRALVTEQSEQSVDGAVIMVSRLVGVIALVVASGAVVPLASLAGMRLVLLAAVGIIVSLIAVQARVSWLRHIPVNALLALALGPGLALAVVFTQARSLTGGLALLTGGVGVLFSVVLAERRALSSEGTSVEASAPWQILLRGAWGVLLFAGFLVTCLSALTWRPLAGAVAGLLALPVVLVAATSVERAQGQRAVSLAARKALHVHWLLCALTLVGLVGWGALSRWVF